MTSHDVRDMLDLPGEAAPRPAKKQKVSAPRPVLKGLAREVQNLGGDNPIAIVPEATVFKKRRFGARKPAAKWEQRRFTNSARGIDKATFTLKHWRRKEEVPPMAGAEDGGAAPADATRPEPQVEDSTFAKYNVQVSVPQYDDAIYNSNLRDGDGDGDGRWTKDETDYLMQQAQEYDLRWPIIWDRYEYTPPMPQMEDGAMEVALVPIRKDRTMEHLKARYYYVAAQMMQINKKVEVMTGPEYDLLQRMQQYNPQTEEARKKFAENAFTRTKEEAREEESLILELKRIMARSERLSEERRELYARLEAPQSSNNIGIFTSSAGLQSLFQQLVSSDKSKKNRRSLMEGVSPAGPSSLSQQPSYDRRESSVRESTSGPSGMNNKKSAQPGISERRVLTPEEEALFGVRRQDRITTSGPAFRHDKIMKPVTSKSTSQQQKITNVLTEIGVRPRLIMPTHNVGVVYDELLKAVNDLLDLRKQFEKLQGEVNIAKAQKEARERQLRADRGEPEPAGEEGINGSADGEGKEDDGNVEGDIKAEERGESAAPGSRPSTRHKRSASVLSTSGDNEAKRLKK